MGLEGKLRLSCSAAVAVLLCWLAVCDGRQMTDMSHHHNSLNIQHPPCFFNPLCTCSKAVPDLGIVTCRDTPFHRVPAPVNSSKVFMLNLDNNGMDYIEPHFLEGTGLYGLRIRNNPIVEVPDEAFQGLERSLWQLELSHLHLAQVPSRSLRHLQRLRYLNLTGNEIVEVSAEDWRGLEETLQTLSLADNNIANLPDSAFSSLTSLESLDLSGNAIAELSPDTFTPPPQRLARLYMSDNQLRHVPYRQVGNLRLLRTLDLSHNRITQLHSATMSEPSSPGSQLSLDTLRLNHNNIQYLPPGAFQHFDVLNRTFLDGNPLALIQTDAFRDARIRELSLVDCGLQELSPSAFSGLEPTLQFLDLSGNNLTVLPPHLLTEFDFLRTLYVRDNVLYSLPAPSDNRADSGFQYSLYRLDLSGRSNSPTSLQSLRRMRNLRWLSISKMPGQALTPDDFIEYSVDLEELHIRDGGLKTIKPHAFRHVRGLRKLDFSDSSISGIDVDAFQEVGHSLTSLRMSHALSNSLKVVPSDALKPLSSLQSLDLSHNYLQTMPETSFHFLRRLRTLKLQDNRIDAVIKGTFQGDIHSSLEDLYLSFNKLSTVNTHTFVDLASLRQLRLDDNVISRIERRAFVNLDNLRVLTLRGNKINYVSNEGFQNLPEIEELDLAYNHLNTFDFASLDQVGTLATFKLNISFNHLFMLEMNNSLTGREMVMHSNVKVLDMSHNNITRVGRGYFRPVEASLTHLHMAYNSLFNVTRDSYGNLPHLQWLDLSSNELYEVDFDSFRNSKKLQVLYMNNNHLSDVPSELFRDLSNLRVVDFSGNRLRSLPDSLFNEQGLEKFSASRNQLSRLPVATFGLSAAATLCELDLSHNAISTLHSTESFSRFRSLTSLDLSYNRLVKLEDATFSSMPRLASLELSHNIDVVLEPRGRSFKGLEHSLIHLGLSNTSLSSVPELHLSRLVSLQLSANTISQLPPEMASNMSSLRYLDLGWNSLSQVPLVTHSLPRLRSLSIAHNRITALTNTSLLGGAERLSQLDIRHLPLGYFEMGALSKLRVLNSLDISSYSNIRDFNLPTVLQNSYGLRNLHMEIEGKTSLSDEMYGEFPPKVRNITITGKELRTLGNNILQGVRYPELRFTLRNTSVEKVPRQIFTQMHYVRNISLDLRNNSLRAVGNPSTGNFLNTPQKTFLNELWLAGNNWKCDCDLGWVEVWGRKKRQLMCTTETGDWACGATADDLRETRCHNRNLEPLIEVLKSDIECGWGAAAVNQGTMVLITFTLIVSFFVAF
ncbi:hypothetical protein LSTR_LSTR002630 [Laodelphax striatellus]|uniref:Chaoptin n=1 Tax=Laodelphax striatellus TaxID=195883 RepID=A0A482XM31_LAOST|nr:hypothetical protein LSTR_LSTR002630 [Laodelphax striatellus]